MKIPELELEIVVASRDSAKRLTHAEPALSCVISIHGKSEMPAQLPDARAVESFVFDDVIRDEPRPELFAPRVGHALGILEAAKRFRGQPLLVHWSLESLPTGSQRYSRLKACATSIRFNASTLLTF